MPLVNLENNHVTSFDYSEVKNYSRLGPVIFTSHIVVVFHVKNLCVLFCSLLLFDLWLLLLFLYLLSWYRVCDNKLLSVIVLCYYCLLCSLELQ